MVQKFGRQSGLQRYRCAGCRRCFQSVPKRRLVRNHQLWQSYAWHRKTLALLGQETSLSARQVRRIIHTAPASPPPKSTSAGKPVVLVIDTTYFDRYGVMVFRCWTRRQNLLWYFVGEETVPQYLTGIECLRMAGYTITAVVCDGLPGLAQALTTLGYPVQYCQFHLMKTVTRYLTRHPQLPAGQELRRLSLTLPKSNQFIFRVGLGEWHGRWQEFLKERTVDPATGHWQYTHRRIRAAYRAIIRAWPHLFTYQRFPKGTVPNTTNTLDGSFSQLKQKVHVHRGLNYRTQIKLVSTLLAASPGEQKPTKDVH